MAAIASHRQSTERCPNTELRKRLDFTDAQLLAECEVHRHRASGPGGQHRNKVSSAIRLRHKPSDLVAIGAESRLQGENQARALRRLRIAIALVARVPCPNEPAWPRSVHVVRGRLRVSESNPGFPAALALVLDAFVDFGGHPAPVAKRLGITGSSLTRFLRGHPQAWREVVRIRADAGLPPLIS